MKNMSGECEKCGLHALECVCKPFRREMAKITFEFDYHDDEELIIMHNNVHHYNTALSQIYEKVRDRLKYHDLSHLKDEDLQLLEHIQEIAILALR